MVLDFFLVNLWLIIFQLALLRENETSSLNIDSKAGLITVIKSISRFYDKKDSDHGSGVDAKIKKKRKKIKKKKRLKSDHDYDDLHPFWMKNTCYFKYKIQ